MDFGQAAGDAEELIGILGILSVLPVLFIITQNIGNSDFEMRAAVLYSIGGIVEALMPAIGSTIIVAVLLYSLANLGF